MKKKATTIYLVRHGEVHNPENLIYGRIPGYRLNENGRKQAELLGKFLSTKTIQAIYASPLQRANETAHILSSFLPPAPFSHDERLIEVGSPLQGKPTAIFETISPIKFNFYLDEYIQQGGESIETIWKRMSTALTDIQQKHEGQEVVAVSHGDPIMITRAFHRGEPLAVESIRGDYYVGHTRGIQLTFTGKSVEIQDLDF